MQFLKSTLFPDQLGPKSKIHKDKEIEELKKRIKDLEEENKKSSVALESIGSYVSQTTVIMTSLANELATLMLKVDAMAETDDSSSLKSYLMPDDDDGYIH